MSFDPKPTFLFHRRRRASNVFLQIHENTVGNKTTILAGESGDNLNRFLLPFVTPLVPGSIFMIMGVIIITMHMICFVFSVMFRTVILVVIV